MMKRARNKLWPQRRPWCMHCQKDLRPVYHSESKTIDGHYRTVDTDEVYWFGHPSAANLSVLSGAPWNGQLGN